MTYYTEMAEIAEKAQANWIRRRDTCVRFLNSCQRGFAEYCQIPSGCLQLMPWDEREEVFKATDQKFVAFPHARYNEDADEWGIGICIRLNPLNHFPALPVTFGLFATEQASKLIVRAGSEDTTTIDPGDLDQMNAFYDRVIASIKAAFTDAKHEDQSRYGFQVGQKQLD